VKNRPLIFIGVLLFVALFTWVLSDLAGSAVKGGTEEFKQWRAQNVGTYYFMWGAEVLCIAVPLLWFVGRRLNAEQSERDEQLLAARGVGQIAGQALRGDDEAIAKLIKLLNDREPVVRYQSARALVLVDKPESNRELFRKVSYWPGDQKLAMVEVLSKMKDIHARKLLKVLTEDRSPLVAGRARSALAMISGRATDMTDIVAKRKRETAAREARAAGKTKKPPAPDHET
jgi:HEAT repeat protein